MLIPHGVHTSFEHRLYVKQSSDEEGLLEVNFEPRAKKTFGIGTQIVLLLDKEVGAKASLEVNHNYSIHFEVVSIEGSTLILEVRESCHTSRSREPLPPQSELFELRLNGNVEVQVIAKGYKRLDPEVAARYATY